MSNLHYMFILLAVLLFLQNSGRVHCHTNGLRPRRSEGKGLSTNMTRVQYPKEQFMKWENFVGSLKHSIFKAVKNKLVASYTLHVDKDPSVGDFTSIQEAIDSLPFINLVRVVIKVHAEGAGADETVVKWSDIAQTPGSNGRPLGTYGSATFAVNSPYFIAKNIAFQNTTPVPAPGAIGKQAVALRISADTGAFVGCKFLGAQDTFYDHVGRHYYKDCYTEGSVDFIFGNSLSLFEVTGSGALYLGRAWGPFSRVVFAYTYMDNIIIPKGWYNWGDPNREMYVTVTYLHILLHLH
ncbi:hypothetical protein VNO80_12716 [Phaseolus coccineus]|uniref:pectinesterase n=1 Tax=Phaseolus coccineus TaxID=3886 RepID=A0AAN9R9H6_PHACN